ncbi:hypothetical protein Tco_0645202, partial [Tanacetum coccineum]
RHIQLSVLELLENYLLQVQLEL